MCDNENLRKERGRAIANQGNQIKKVNDHSFKVKSQSGSGSYDVKETPNGMTCDFKTDSPYDAEDTFHEKFSHKQVHDEWFALDEADVKFIRSIEKISEDTLRLLSL